MKKTLFFLVAAVLLSLSALSADLPPVTVTVDGELVAFDQPPVIVDGRTLIPVRAVVEKLGFLVFWHEESETVVIVTDKDAPAAIVTDPGVHVTVNGELVAFDVPPQVIGGRTLIPIRAVCEKLGCTVGWDEATQRVSVETAAYAASKSEIIPITSVEPVEPVEAAVPDRSTPSAPSAPSVAMTGKTVYITATGSKYHTKTCRFAKNAVPVDLAVARAYGLEACAVCH